MLFLPNTSYIFIAQYLLHLDILLRRYILDLFLLHLRYIPTCFFSLLSLVLELFNCSVRSALSRCVAGGLSVCIKYRLVRTEN